MPEVHCFTSATLAYLDRARVLGQTLRRHQPDWHLTLLLSDEEPPGFTLDLAHQPFDRLVRITELGIPDLRAWMFEHDVVELCTAVKGPMLLRMLDEGARKVVYLDPDMALLADMGQVGALLSRCNLVLTPHQLLPDTTPTAIRDNEIASLQHGIFNLGFLAVAGTDEGRRFAAWWRDRLLAHCFDDVPNGLFTDQRWCDHAPALFRGVHILRDPGVNVASWNLSQRPVSIDMNGGLLAAGQALRLFHFTKVNSIGEAMLDRYAGGRIEVFELMRWYRDRLAANRAEGLPEGWWAFGRYDDGTPIPRQHRRRYRDTPKLRAQFPDPFAAPGDAFD